MTTPPEPGWQGWNWGLIEWIASGVGVVSTSVTAWVFNISIRLEKLAMKIDELEGKTEGLSTELADAKSQADVLRQRLEELHRELPSKHFIENQLNQQTLRIDQLMAAKMAGRS